MHLIGPAPAVRRARPCGFRLVDRAFCRGGVGALVLIVLLTDGAPCRPVAAAEPARPPAAGVERPDEPPLEPLDDAPGETRGGPNPRFDGVEDGDASGDDEAVPIPRRRYDADNAENADDGPVAAGAEGDDESLDGQDDSVAVVDWSSLLRDLGANLVPKEVTNDDDWGQTETIAAGVKVKTKGGRVWFEPRTKRVNHGLWRRVRIKPLHPDKTLQISVAALPPGPNGERRSELWLQLRVRSEVQFAHWVYGVKGLNGTAEADATVQLRLTGAVELSTAPAAGWLPAVRLTPTISDLDLKLSDLDVRRIGVVGGWAAEELGNGARKGVENLLQSQEPRLLTRARRKLAKAAADWTWRPGDFELPNPTLEDARAPAAPQGPESETAPTPVDAPLGTPVRPAPALAPALPAPLALPAPGSDSVRGNGP